MNLTILAPRTARDYTVIQTLSELVDRGVVRPFIVLTDGERGRLLQPNEATETEKLSTLLGRLGRLDLVRILAISFDVTPVDRDWVTRLSALRSSLADAAIPVTIGSLSGCLAHEKLPEDLFSVFWNHNTIVVPQESLGEPGTFPVMIEDEERLSAVAVASTALVGSLWTWLSRSPFDDLEHSGENNIQRVRLCRVITRVVDAGDLVSRAMDRALAPGVSLPPPPSCTRHGSPADGANDLLSFLAPTDGGSPIGFAYHPFVIPPPTGPTTLTFLKAITYFFSELVEQLRPIPRQAIVRHAEEMRRRLESAVQAGTFGKDRGVVVSLSKPTNEKLLTNHDARAEVVRSLPGLKTAPVTASPATWEQLLSLVLASADGSTVDRGFEAAQLEWNGRRAVIDDLSLLAPLPDATEHELILSVDELRGLGINGGNPIALRSHDAYSYRNLVLRTVQETAGRSDTDDAVLTPVGDDEASPVESTPIGSDDTSGEGRYRLRRSSGKSGSERTNAERQEDTGQTDKTPPVESAESTQPQTDFVGIDPAITKERLHQWATNRESTLTWRLAQRLVDAQNRALDDLSKTQSELDSIFDRITEFYNAVAAYRSKFIRRALFATLGFLLLIGATIYGVRTDNPVAWKVGAGLLVIALIACTYAVFKSGQKRVQLKHRLDELSRLPALLANRRNQASSEFQRLSNYYHQYMDWADVASSALHRPWGTVRGDQVNPWTTRTGVLSFSVGEPAISQEELVSTALSVTQNVAVQGWLSLAFAERRNRWLQWYGDLTKGIAGLPSTPEMDTSFGSDTIVSIPAETGMPAIEVRPPRSEFTAQFTAGGFADEYRARQVAGLRQSVGQRELSRLVSSVASDVSGLDGRDVTEFLCPPVENPNVPGFGHETFVSARYRAQGTLTFETFAGISPALGASIPEGRGTLAIQDLESRFLLASARVDLSDAIPAVDCPLIDFQTRTIEHKEEPSTPVIRRG